MHSFALGFLKKDSIDDKANLSKALRVYKGSANIYNQHECSQATLQTKVFYKFNNLENEIAGKKIEMSNGQLWADIDLTELFEQYQMGTM